MRYESALLDVIFKLKEIMDNRPSQRMIDLAREDRMACKAIDAGFFWLEAVIRAKEKL